MIMNPVLSVTVLADNNTITDKYFLGEPGLSFLIEADNRKILFDTGYSDVFIRNAEKTGAELRDLDYLVLSHGHLDHTWGIVHLVRLLTEAKINHIPHRVPELIAHPCCFYPRVKPPLRNIGSLLCEDEVRRQFSVRLSAQPVWITKNLVFLGEIPRKFTFEQGDFSTRGIVMPDGRIEPDQLQDDSALVCRTAGGLVIITGCSHSGICNITHYARSVCGEQRVIDIIGGLHLLSPDNARVRKTGEYVRGLHLKSLHACHCTSLSSKIALANYCPIAEVGVGMKLEW
jgi:7,8-dihydropterin-6-yl-methyl-4-(beta-D-ribofuranosyl)aminobenzene 5'-phosphate synthase